MIEEVPHCRGSDGRCGVDCRLQLIFRCPVSPDDHAGSHIRNFSCVVPLLRVVRVDYDDHGFFKEEGLVQGGKSAVKDGHLRCCKMGVEVGDKAMRRIIRRSGRQAVGIGKYAETKVVPPLCNLRKAVVQWNLERFSAKTCKNGLLPDRQRE